MFASVLGWGEVMVGLRPEQPDHFQYIRQLDDACTANDNTGDLQKYKEAWLSLAKRRKNDPEFDDKLINENRCQVLECIKFAIRHRQASWREEGVKQAQSFLHNQTAREKLEKMDFVGSLLLITFSDEGGEGETDEAPDLPVRDERAQEAQFLAAQIICDMADYKEFLKSLCKTQVVNFLCVVLNQLPIAVQVVTHTFVKLCHKEENIPILIEGSVADILESFFKTVSYKRPSGQDEVLRDQWKRDIMAMSFCAYTLGQFIKFHHPLQADLKTVISVVDYCLTESEGPSGDFPDNTNLLCNLARFFYWSCRCSPDFVQLLQAAGNNDEGVLYPLKVLERLWKRCVETHRLITDNMDIIADSRYDDFMVDDIDPSKKLVPNSEEGRQKIKYALQRVCYVNCTMWIIIPVSNFRWKLKHLGLNNLHLAFQLTSSDLVQNVLSTVRYLVDLPHVQECVEFVEFFGVQLLSLVDDALEGRLDDDVVRLLLDALSIISMQRQMQALLADESIYPKLTLLLNMEEAKSKLDKPKLELAVLRILAEVAMYPAHRLAWVCKTGKKASDVYPPREEFQKRLGRKSLEGSDEHAKTMAALLLTYFKEDKLATEADELNSTFKAIWDWWSVNTTANVHERKEDYSYFAAALGRRRVITSMEAMKYSAPHECIVALSLFSRLALEPKFKRFFTDSHLQILLKCVEHGIWSEAREAAATLANLMWLPDDREELLVCWLKFDGAKCIAVDAANVLLPVKWGNPKAVELGKGMYRSTWGIEFVTGSCVMLHPDGLKTSRIPGVLTSASPSDTFANTSCKAYEWLEKRNPHPKNFSISCWFFWPLAATTGSTQHVLVETRPVDGWSQIFLDRSENAEGVWTITDDRGVVRPLRTPKLNPGWHMLTLVSSTSDGLEDGADRKPLNGSTFWLDDWHCELRDIWVKNEFYVVGNEAPRRSGSETETTCMKPFGLMCDFRIYARSLSNQEVMDRARGNDKDAFPDRIAKRLAAKNAATIFALRLDVPDSAAECLRALGSLATVQTQRAQIYSVCGREVLKLLDSPQPMLQRQAARLVTNIT